MHESLASVMHHTVILFDLYIFPTHSLTLHLDLCMRVSVDELASFLLTNFRPQLIDADATLTYCLFEYHHGHLALDFNQFNTVSC